jgi:hypothetical protein
VPAAQTAQLVAPVASWEVPGAQAAHAAAAVAAAKVPALQLGQTTIAPLLLWNLPAAHDMQEVVPLPVR